MDCAKVNFITSIIMIKLKGFFMLNFVILGSLNKKVHHRKTNKNSSLLQN